jgi:probable HAF family extracellular repeat protein
MKWSVLRLGALVIALDVVRADAATFTGIGDLPAGVFFSTALGVSSDGSTVVGQGNGSIEEAFRWSAANGMEGIGELLGGDQASHAEAVSADGSVVVGRSHSAIGPQAFRWTPAGGMQALGSQTGHAYGVSAAGDVVAGTLDDPFGQPSGNNEAFRWSLVGGMEGLGFLPGGESYSDARAISADASVIVGFAATEDLGSGLEAFRWTAATGMVGLGSLGTSSRAWGVSDDGLTVVGEYQHESGGEAFRWNDRVGMEGLGDLPGGDFSSVAYDSSADGAIVVGCSESGRGQEAFIWDSLNGMRSLRDVLTDDFGLDLGGWQLERARSVSADGKTVVGFGINPDGNTEAWVAYVQQVPEPASIVLCSIVGLYGVVVSSRRTRR